jgi:hypothetical protein
VQSGRGAGLHHMTGLSNPVLCWFNAYYQPGRLTAGFDTWIEEQHSAGDHSRMEATIRLYGAAGRRALVLASCGQAAGTALPGRAAKSHRVCCHRALWSWRSRICPAPTNW